MELLFNIDLSNKIAVITGGGGVLGGEFAKTLAQCGAKTIILDIDGDKAEEVAQEIIGEGGESLAIETDVLDVQALKAARERINKQFGACDILINAAGGNHPKGTTSKEYLFEEDLNSGEDIQTFFDLTEDGVKFVFNLNFLGTFLTSQTFGKDLIKKSNGTIINISSMNSFIPLTKIPAYSAAKAAVSNFTQWLAVHFSKVQIRVNAIAPGFFLTDQNRSLLLNDDGSYTDRAKKILSQTPMERFGLPEDLIGTLLWLVDDNLSGFITGIVVPVDGGFSAYSGV
jgi:NAD(P)-dependent dehydrogenase (short-subunit alcohol dehydrogenase family)